MTQFTREEKLGLFQRGVQRRLEGSNGYIDNISKNIKSIQEKRKLLTDRIQKYSKDKVVTDILEAQLTQFDKQYTSEASRLKLLIEEVKESEPQVKRLKQILDKGEYDKELVELIVDLFLGAVLIDWNEFEQDKEEKLKNEAKGIEKPEQ